MRFALILVFGSSAFFAAGCKQGVGDRCVQDSDCASGVCSITGQSAQGGKCLASATTAPTGSGGTGAAAGQGGGHVGQGGASGQGGNGGNGGSVDAAQDASSATDANPG